MTYWFSSDYHFSHFNIIKYSKRPFKTVGQMNNTIIQNHNSRVKPTDTVFFLGDFNFHNTKGGKKGEGEPIKAETYITQLNGRFVFIRGNHDFSNGLNTCINGVVINLGGKDIYLTHQPQDYEPNIKLNLVGHVHKLWRTKILKSGNILYNVGVDVHNYYPVSINEIFKNLNDDMKLLKVNQNESQN